MLGHANISQTDTYLNATRMGLHDSMERFDAIRCNPVAIEQPIEHRLDGNGEPPRPPKGLLH
jgi:hypothetical protein